MTDIDKELRDALRKGQERAEAGRIPDFNTSWSRAERIAVQQRRRIGAMVGVAAAAALVAVAFVSQQRQVDQDWLFVNPDELASSTSWTAPSDILLPKHQFDIYGEIPVLIESTERDGGTLL
jgi:hypothetical protein